MSDGLPKERSLGRSGLAAVMYELSDDISEELAKESLDPAKVMRLTALGVDYCLVALATLLDDNQE